MHQNVFAPQGGDGWRRYVQAGIITLVMSLSAICAGAAREHACDYLSKDEVATVLAVHIGEVEAQPTNPMGQNICFFDIPAGMAPRFAQLQMVRTQWAERSGKGWNAPSLFENNISFLENLQEIAGVGEKAYWGGSGMKLGGGLHVLYKDTYINVQAVTGDEQNNLQKARELATVVLKKIE